jgi:hypothetical protein
VATRREFSRDDLIEQLRAIGERRGKDTIARSEFLRETGITEWQVMKRFDSWNALVEAAGMRPYRSSSYR